MEDIAVSVFKYHVVSSVPDFQTKSEWLYLPDVSLLECQMEFLLLLLFKIFWRNIMEYFDRLYSVDFYVIPSLQRTITFSHLAWVGPPPPPPGKPNGYPWLQYSSCVPRSSWFCTRAFLELRTPAGGSLLSQAPVSGTFTLSETLRKVNPNVSES